MKISHLVTAASALALLGGAAMAQTAATQPPVNPMPGQAGAAATDPTMGAATSGAAATDMTAPGAASATAAGSNVSATVTTTTVTNGPVADTPENRAKYGQPLSRAGKRTAAKGN